MSGASDIKLKHGQVVVNAWDLVLDSPDRRKNRSVHRRALVHDFNDGLTINWGNDYPGGVTINKLNSVTLDKFVRTGGGAGNIVAGVRYQLTIDAEDITYKDNKGFMGRGTEIKVIEEIKKLRKEIKELKDKIENG